MISLRAPAKINLFLRVGGRRADGYHDIESVMQMVGLYDDVSVQPRRRGIEVRVLGDELPTGPGNLVYEAATTLAQEAGIATGATISLTKRIPIGAGLGGGSSDAAATLVALNRLWGLRCSRARLSEIGAALGSDVPFFFHGPTAWVTGRGECVRRIARPRLVGEPSPSGWAVLVNPGFAVSTRWAFEGLRLRRPARGSRTASQAAGRSTIGLTNQKSTRTIPRLPGAPALAWCPVENSLEVITVSEYPVIEEIKGRLRDAGASIALMSGSGPTVFGLFPIRADAVRARAGLPHAWKGWVVKLLRRMPW